MDVIRFNEMGASGLRVGFKSAESRMAMPGKGYPPEARSALLPRAGEDYPVGVVADDEMVLVEQHGTIVIAEFTQTDEVVCKAIYDVSHSRGGGKGGW